MPHPETDVLPETEKDSSGADEGRARPGAFETAPKYAPLPEEPVEPEEDE